MSRLRAICQAWDQNPVSVSNRRFIYRFVTPLMLAAFIFYLVLGQWVVAGLTVVLVAIGLEAGARTPGTRAQQLVCISADASDLSERRGLRSGDIPAN